VGGGPNVEMNPLKIKNYSFLSAFKFDVSLLVFGMMLLNVSICDVTFVNITFNVILFDFIFFNVISLDLTIYDDTFLIVISLMFFE
jgi:hypothetical protein